VQQVESFGHRNSAVGRLDAVDPQHVGAEVGQQHGGERTGADAAEFEDSDTGEGAHCALVGGASQGGAYVRVACTSLRHFSTSAATAALTTGAGS
jgi:hypothetical protein